MAYTTIDDPSAHFQTTLYTGDGNSGRTVTNSGNSDMQPDWIWIKYRTAGVSHVTYDSSRGATKRLYIDFDGQEATQSEGVQAFNSDGFTLGNAGASNANSIPFVAWQWKANGGTTSTNSDGDINSTVQVNSDAGFSIITDSPSNNTARNIGHGLGKTPTFIIRRARNRTENWRVLFQGFGTTGAINLDQEGTYNSSTVLFNGVSSTTFGVGTDLSVNGAYNYVTYCFTDIQGFSKSGKYTGNQNAEGPFIYTGFKPAFIIFKANSNYKYWYQFDNQRSPANPVQKGIVASLSDAEYNTADIAIDFLSNGFKIRNNSTTLNESGTTIAYMAFADNPFVTSTGIPTTAR